MVRQIHRSRRAAIRATALAATAPLVAGCPGGGGGDDTTEAPPTTVAAPVDPAAGNRLSDAIPG